MNAPNMRSPIAIDAIEALESFGVTPATRHLVDNLLPLWSRWPEMQARDIDAVHDYFAGDTPRESDAAGRLSQVRALVADYAAGVPPLFRGPGLSQHGQGYVEGMRAMARAVLAVLDGDDA